MIRTSSRLLTTLLCTVSLILAAAVPALAHVTVNPGQAYQGDSAKLAFRVPTEEDARTTQLQVTLPKEQPIPLVFVRQHTGWSYKIKKIKLDHPIEAFGMKFDEVVSSITWTADHRRSAIGPDEFDEFEVFVAPLPTADQMVFNAVQTYDNGDVIRWDEPTVPGQPAPKHPAPVLKLTPKAQTDPAVAFNPVVAKDFGRPSSPGNQGNSSGGFLTPGTLISSLALLLGAAGLVTGISARRRSRRSAAEAR